MSYLRKHLNIPQVGEASVMLAYRCLLVVAVAVVCAIAVVDGGCGVQNDATTPAATASAKGSALTIEQSLAAIESQRDIVKSATEVENAMMEDVDLSGIDEDRLRAAVAHGTVWGSFGSLDLVKSLLLRGDYTAVADGKGASLGDVLRYTFGQKVKDPGIGRYLNLVHGSVEKDYRLKEREVLLLDGVTLGRLKGLTSFREHVSSQLESFRFAVPEGWSQGVNMFNAVRWADIVKRMSKQYVASSGPCEGSQDHYSCVLTRMFREPVLNELRELFGPLAESRVIWLHPNAQHKYYNTNAGDVRANLLEARIAAADFKERVDYGKGCDTGRSLTGEQVAEDISKEGLFVSIGTMGRQVMKVYDEMVRQNLERPSDHSGGPRVLCVMEADKSTGVVLHLFVETTGLNPAMIRACRKDGITAAVDGLTTREESKATLILVDDLALSGQQMYDYAALLCQVSQRVVIAPLYYTDDGKGKIEQQKKLCLAHKKRMYFIGGEQVESPSRQLWMMATGYQEQVAMTVLPYMAPDNNNYFFRNFIADLFTFHHSGVKLGKQLSGAVKPDCPKRSTQWLNNMALCIHVVMMCGEDPVWLPQYDPKSVGGEGW